MLQRQTATADAGSELALHQLQGVYAAVQQRLPLAGDPLPVVAIRRATIGQPAESRHYLVEGEAHPLRHPDKGDAAQHILGVETPAAFATQALDQPLLLVEAQGAGVHAGTFGYLAYGQPLTIRSHP